MNVKPLLPRIQAPSRIIYVWALAFGAVVVYSIGWFALSPVFTSTLEALNDAYGYTGTQATLFDLVVQVVYWNPLFMLFGLLLWGFLNSQRPSDRLS